MKPTDAKPSQKPRWKARASALQVLYQLDLNRDLKWEVGIGHFRELFAKEGVVDPFTQRIVEGVVQHNPQIDEKIQQVSERWKMTRMPPVDRNVLRMGVFELLYCDDIPATVTVNEMIELAKQFGSEHSAAYVNGVLDKIAENLNNPNKAP